MKYTSLSIAAFAAAAAAADTRPMSTETFVAADGFAVSAGGGSACDGYGLGTASAVTAGA